MRPFRSTIVVCGLVLPAVLAAQVPFDRARRSIPLNTVPSSFAVGDIDGDGLPETLLPDSTYEDAPTLRTTVARHDQVVGYVLSTTDSLPFGSSSTLADFDGDTDLDFISLSGSQFQIVFNQGGTQGGAEGTWGSPVLYSTSTGGGGDRLAVADLDNDGDLDLAIPVIESGGGHEMVVRKNLGGIQGGTPGTFGAPAIHIAGSEDNALPFGIAAGDVDGDLDVDIVVSTVSNVVTPELCLFRNQGGLQGGTLGTFAAQSIISQGASPSPFVVVRLFDIDGDGDLDIVAGANNSGDSAVSVFRNQGGLQGGTPGTFGLPAKIAIELGVVDIAHGDFDGDLDEDMLVLADGGEATAFANAGDGTMDATHGFFAGSYPLVLADFDGDDDLDAFAVSGHGVTVTLSEAGWFLDTPEIEDAPLALGVAVLDVDNDGDCDLLSGNAGDSGLSIRINQGAGVFGGAVPVSWTGSFESNAPIVPFDADRDGDMDAIIGRRFSSSGMSVAKNNGGVQGGTLGTYAVEPPIGTLRGQAIVTGDVDNDGDTDFVEISQASLSASRIGTWVNQGGAQGGAEGTFAIREDLPSTPRTTALALGDLDGDADLDIVIGIQNFASGHDAVTIYWNRGGAQGGTVGTYAPTSFTTLGAMFRSTAIALDDVDMDGDLDIAYAGPASISPNMLNVPAVAILVNQGGAQSGTPGSFVEDAPVIVPCTGISQILAMDADGDGDRDLATLVVNDGVVDILYNQGGYQGGNVGDFGLPAVRHFSAGTNAYFIEAADLNGDGATDLVVANAPLVPLVPGGLDLTVSGDLSILINGVPSVVSVEVVGAQEVLVEFSEPMGSAALAPFSYAVSGNGRGTLAEHPDSVSQASKGASSNTYVLTWASGEMVSGEDITITVSPSVADLNGNSVGFSTAQTDEEGGIGPDAFVPIWKAYE